MIGKATAQPKFNFDAEKAKHFERCACPDADSFLTSQSKELYDWYMSRSPKIPSRKDFDIIKHWHLAPYLYLIDVLEDGTFHYRLNGEQVVEILGHNQRGMTLGHEDDLPVNSLFVDHLNEMIESRQTMRCIGDLSLLDRSHIKFESFDCPLEDSNGRVSHILGVISLIK